MTDKMYFVIDSQELRMNQEQISPDQNQSNQPNQSNQNQPTETKKTSPILYIVLAIVVIGALGYFAYSSMKPEEEAIVITPAIEPTVSPTSTSATPSPTATTVADETADWKVYTNDSFGLSFKYPKTYEITQKKDIKADSIGGSLSLSDNSRNGIPTLVFLFNPDGFGPGNGDIHYNTKIQNNKLVIEKRTEFDKTELNDDNKTKIGFDIGNYSNISKFENGIIVFFSYTKGNYEEELKDIINTIEITKPEIYGKKTD